MNKVLTFFIFSIAFGVFGWVLPTTAQAATIFFEPNPLTIGQGNTSEVQVMVNTDKAVYSVDVTVSYPTNIVVADGATTKNTNFPTTVFVPTRDNNTGLAKFKLAATAPGFTGSKGVIGTITLRGQRLGTGQLKVVSAQLIHVNNTGDSNIYTGSTPGNIVVNTEQEPQYVESGEIGPVPVVTSTSHPDGSKWYPERSVVFAWDGAEAYNWVFDQDPETIPPPSSRGAGETTTIGGVGDGVWYIHVRGAKGNIWGATTTFKVQVDGSPPPGFNLQFEPEAGDSSSALPLIRFEADGAESGIDRYELSLDDGDFVVVRSPYQLPQIEPGEHTIVVKAFDKAGNETEARATITLTPLSPKPVIESPQSGTTFSIGEDGKFAGAAPPNSSVQLFANGQFVMAVDADENGKFEITLNTQLEPGDYEFTVRAVMPGHLYSEFSDPVSGTVAPGGGGLSIGGFVVPLWITLILYVVIILLLVGGLGYLFIRWRKAKKEQKLALQKLELMTEEDPNSEAPADAKPIDTGVGQEAK